MHVYRLSISAGAARRFHGTREAAQAEARRFPALFHDAFIQLIDLPTDKDALIALLNDNPSVDVSAPPLRHWQLTRRGGLQETDADGYRLGARATSAAGV